MSAPKPSKRTLEIALASVERDIDMVVEARAGWREMIETITAAAELEEAIEKADRKGKA